MIHRIDGEYPGFVLNTKHTTYAFHVLPSVIWNISTTAAAFKWIPWNPWNLSRKSALSNLGM